MTVTMADAVAGLMLLGILLYALLAGADFGGGAWDLLASGPRAADQRRLIEKAISPVWEANHVWLVFVVVLLFTGFPRAYAVASVALHIPLTLMLLGIVFRGSAFMFRQYGEGGRKQWGRVFAVASVITPVFFGVVVGAITAEDIRAPGGVVESGFFAPWLRVFPFAVGLLTLALFAFLAATYLTGETDDAALQDDFRARAFGAGAAVVVAGIATAIVAGPATVHFRDRFLGSWWTAPLLGGTALAAAGAFVALWRRRFRWARAAAAAIVSLVLIGWALAQRPYLIAPDVSIDTAAAPPATLRLLLIAIGGGSAFLIPCLYWLFRVFKSRAI